MTSTHILHVSETEIITRFVWFEVATAPTKLQLGLDLWSGYEAVKESTTQYFYLKRITDGMAAHGVKKNPEQLYPYLYSGCAQANGFELPDVASGEPIGKAIDRFGLTAEEVRAHLAAGTLQEAIRGRNAPTQSVRLTREAVNVLDDASALARELLDVTGLSEPEVRALLPKAFQHAPPALRSFLLRLGNGDVDLSKTYLVTADEQPEGTTLKAAAPPPSYLEWGKQFGRCWVCGKEAEGQILDAHHVAYGGHEARRNDGGPEKFALVHRACHIPQPFSPTVTAHSRAFSVGRDVDALVNFIEYDAREHARYEAWIRGEA